MRLLKRSSGDGSAERAGVFPVTSTTRVTEARKRAINLSVFIGPSLYYMLVLELVASGDHSASSFTISSSMAFALAGPLPTRVMRIFPFLSMTVTWGIPLTP